MDWKIFYCSHPKIFMILSFFSFFFCYSITVFHHYLPLFIRHFFIHFSTYINSIYIVHSTALSGFLIYSFISLYSLNTFFTETNLSWLIYELAKVLEIRMLIVFNVFYANNIILSCFLLLFLDNWPILFNSCSYYTSF